MPRSLLCVRKRKFLFWSNFLDFQARRFPKFGLGRAGLEPSAPEIGNSRNPDFGKPENPDCWIRKSIILELQKSPQKEILKIQMHVAQNVGKVWIGWKKNLLAPLGASSCYFLHGPNKSKNCQQIAYFPWWSNGPYSPSLEGEDPSIARLPHANDVHVAIALTNVAALENERRCNRVV